MRKRVYEIKIGIHLPITYILIDKGLTKDMIKRM